MKHEPTKDRLPGHWLRRMAERVASGSTCERVLFPLLADLQFEHARAPGPWARVVVQARGVLAFWRALGVTSVIGAGQYLWANAWATGDAEARATKRLFVLFCGATTATALVILTLGWPGVRLIPGNAFALLLPSTLAVAVPVGVLFAFATRAGGPSILVHRRGSRSVAVLAALATFVFAAWLTPAANHEYRARVSRMIAPQVITPLGRHDREMTLDELSARSAELRSIGRNEEAARFDVEWHKKPALAALCLALALAGAAIATARRGGLRFFTALAVAWVAWALLRLGENAADRGHLLPALAMWGPVVLVAVVALAALRFRQHSCRTGVGSDGSGTVAAAPGQGPA